MLRSIRWKMPLVFLLLLLMAMQGVSVYLLRSLETHYVNTFAAGLNERSQLLASFLAGLLPHQPAADIHRFIREFARDAGVEVSILDASGEVISTSGDPQMLGQPIADEGVMATLDEMEPKRFRRSDGADRRLVVTVPIRSQDGPAQGIVYMSASLEGIYETLSEARGATYLASLIALGVTAVLAFAISGTITGPIQEVTSRAGQMAQGDFDQRIPVRSQDEVGQLAAMFNVLTAKVKDTLDEISSEKTKLEAVLNHMADGIVALDRDLKVTILNPAASKMLQTSEEEAKGRLPTDLWPHVPLDDAIDRTLSGQEQLVEQFAIEDPLDHESWPTLVRAGFATLRGEDGQMRGLVIVLQDITEQERLESLRREFVANVSHELRTPLTTVKSYVETLMDGAARTPGVRDRFLEVISAETERMTRLVADLLDLSQIDYEGPRWSLDTFALEALVRETCTRFAPQAEQNGVDLECKLAQATVHASRDRIQQVLLNLLSNAVEFTPSGGTIKVEMQMVDREVEVTVEDSGVGIPRDELPRVLDRFYRVEKGRSRRVGGGTGLGLSIAREIVEGHGGQITIESEPGKGTRVCFTLPTDTGEEIT